MLLFGNRAAENEVCLKDTGKARGDIAVAAENKGQMTCAWDSGTARPKPCILSGLRRLVYKQEAFPAMTYFLNLPSS